MGLELSYTLQSNVTGEYWRVKSVSYDHDLNRGFAIIGFYTNKADRDAGIPPIRTFRKPFDESDFPFTLEAMNADGKNPTEIAYDEIKLMTDFRGQGIDFTGATDV